MAGVRDVQRSPRIDVHPFLRPLGFIGIPALVLVVSVNILVLNFRGSDTLAEIGAGLTTG